MSLSQQVLQVLSNGSPMSALQIAKACGLQTKHDVNPTLYAFAKEGVVHVDKSMTPPRFQIVPEVAVLASPSQFPSDTLPVRQASSPIPALVRMDYAERQQQTMDTVLPRAGVGFDELPRPNAQQPTRVMTMDGRTILTCSDHTGSIADLRLRVARELDRHRAEVKLVHRDTLLRDNHPRSLLVGQTLQVVVRLFEYNAVCEVCRQDDGAPEHFPRYRTVCCNQRICSDCYLEAGVGSGPCPSCKQEQFTCHTTDTHVSTIDPEEHLQGMVLQAAPASSGSIHPSQLQRHSGIRAGGFNPVEFVQVD